jgi:hypothetical protein
LENYLIDERVLFDVIMPNSKRPPESRGTFSNELKGLALGQLTDAVIARVYREFEPPNAGLRPSEVFGKDFNVAAGVLVKRILEIRNQTMTIVSDEWVREFSLRCEAARTSMSEEWSREWIKKCNGKRLIQDLYRKYQIGMDQLTFKKRIIRQMQADASESWRIVESTIRNGLQ